MCRNVLVSLFKTEIGATSNMVTELPAKFKMIQMKANWP